MTKRITLPSIFYKVIVTQCECCIYGPVFMDVISFCRPAERTDTVVKEATVTNTTDYVMFANQ